MGRPAKPLSIHKAEGNPNRLTKDQMDIRERHQIKLGDYNYIEPDLIKKNKVAHQKWIEITNIYIDNDVDFATSSDIGIISRYCMTYSEYQDLLIARNKCLREFRSQKMPEFNVQANMNKLQFENNINKKSALLLKMEGELFLTPLAKVKNIPKEKKESEQESMLEQLGFGNV